MAEIPLSDIEAALAAGWLNVNVLDLSKKVDNGTTVTVILSDDTFTVPTTIGSANVLDSKQYTFTADALLKIRALTRE